MLFDILISGLATSRTAGAGIRIPAPDGGSATRLPLNDRTPVVFVTGSDDPQMAIQTKQSGGVGFILKTALSVEIAVTALTFLARARLAHLEPDETPESALAAAN